MLRIEGCRFEHSVHWILVAASAVACASPTRHFVPDGEMGDNGGSAGRNPTANGGQLSGAAGRYASGSTPSSSGRSGIATTTAGNSSLGTSGMSGNVADPDSGGSPVTVGSAGQSGVAAGGSSGVGNGGTRATSTSGTANVGLGGSTSLGGTSSAIGGSNGASTVASGGSVAVAGSAAALAGSPGNSGGTTTNGGTLATGGVATGGAPALLTDGRPCTTNSECQSANCRLAPSATRYCVAAGHACATSAGLGVAQSSRFCEGILSQVCSATDTLVPQDCSATATCQTGICQASSGTCGMAPANQGALCPNGSATGACDAGACAPLRFSPPGPSVWIYVDGGPAMNVPANCGTAGNPPCAIGDFKFVWPPDTGVVKCYSDSAEVACPGQPGGTACAATSFCGQDGQYGVDVTRPSWSAGRYTQSGTVGNDVVTDNVTGIVWTVSSQSSNKMPWNAAQSFCDNKASAAYGGYTEWRLPSVYQAFSLYDFSIGSSATASSTFPTMTAFYHWTSSTNAGNPAASWIVSTNVPPYVVAEDRTSTGSDTTFGVRCSAVRSAIALASARFYATGSTAETIIFDARTGLLWQRSPETTSRSWKDVLSYCEGLTYGGRTDWRVPNVFELESIIDYSRQNPAIDPVAFPGTQNAFYWTSTTQAGAPTSAWAIRVTEGILALWSSAKSGANPVRCVAGGPT